MHGAARAICRAHDFLRRRGQIVLAQRFADIDPARGQKRVRHAAADDQMIDLADQMLQHIKLGRDFRPADDSCNWMIGMIQRLAQRFQFGLH